MKYLSQICNIVYIYVIELIFIKFINNNLKCISLKSRAISCTRFIAFCKYSIIFAKICYKCLNLFENVIGFLF